MDVPELEKRFGMPGVLRFENTSAGLTFVRVTTPAATASICMQGAHVTEWTPAGQAPVLFLSSRSEMAPGKPIRGGVPIVFPWFSARHDGKTGPAHGFARISEWELGFAGMVGEDMHLAFTLAPNELSRSLGFDHFQLAYRVTIGRTMVLELAVGNDSGAGAAHGGRAAATAAADAAALGAPLVFEEALHTYYAVADARKVSINGLGGTTYIDKVDANKHKVQPEGALVFTGRTDRPYLDTEATCVLHDEAGKRTITVAKAGSRTTVVWNPWSELSATLADMEPDGWLRMTAIETANVDVDTITLAPGKTHTMRVTVTPEALR